MARAKRAAAGAAQKPELFKFPAGLHLDLKAFCEAHYGAPKTRIVQEALKAFISSQLAEEPKLRVRFDEARTRLDQNRAHAIRLLKTDADEPIT